VGAHCYFYIICLNVRLQFSVFMTNMYLMKLYIIFFSLAIKECRNHAIFCPITDFLTYVLALNIFGSTAGETNTTDLLLLEFPGLTKKYMQPFNVRPLNFWYYQRSRVGRYCTENIGKNYDVFFLM
jgi:hypothetical protein